MNKHHHFWLERWQQNDIPFHQAIANPDLPLFWPKLELPPTTKVLVPLCGKSLDMIWLQQQGHFVIGIELSVIAVEQFFSIIKAPYHKEAYENFMVFRSDYYEIWAGDIFQLNHQIIKPVEAIYDRGALIALPHKIRKQYVPHISNWLKDEGKILLKTAVYHQEEMQGPPYSVREQEISNLYHQYSSIEKVKSKARAPEDMQHYMARGCKMFTDETWIIRK